MPNFKNRQSAEILNAVYRNAEMACAASADVLKVCKNNNLFREIQQEQTRYKDVAKNARSELLKRGAEPEEVSPFGKAMTKMGIAMKTLNNQSGSNIAKIMFNGTAMGIIDIQHAVNRSHGAEPKIRESAERLLDRERDYCETLRKYL
ncbi:MAG: hypothetical protein J1F03_05645 [Oscillospiraceae bacterium]|nr:hypothetical protein [Oscillospiraceae bacterium]